MPCTGRRPELAGARLRRHPRGAADQLQLDIYGEAADAIYTGDTYGGFKGSRVSQAALGGDPA